MSPDERRARLNDALLYLVCDSRPGGRPLAEVLEAAIAGGVDIVQLREKRLDDESLTAAAREAREICERLGALLIVNDRPAVARAAGADGVHVGQEDMTVAQARAIVGPELLVGLSTHSPEQIDAAMRGASAAGSPASEAPAEGTGGDGAGGPDYIGVGPVHATPTKPGRPAVGTELVHYASAHSRIPFFAIGGIDAENVAAALAAGARRVAVVRAIAKAEDPEGAARALREALESRVGAA